MDAGDVVAGRFRIERLAGEGGMGQVWRARDGSTGAPAALKVLRAEARAQAARFEREARVLAELRHPGIVGYLAHGTTAAGDLYLAMEWLEGEDLEQRLRARGKLNVDDAMIVGVRVAEALQAAHERGLVHRDLKPSNIFLPGGELGAAKLLDFGVVRQLGEGGAMTQAGVAIGTPGYMAPEQVRGEATVDARTDVFALACVLYECLAGEPAFFGAHVVAILAKVLFDEPASLGELRPDLPPGLLALLAQSMEKQPERRPPDGGAVALALRSLGARRLEPLPVARREGTAQEVPGGRAGAAGAGLSGSELRRLFVVLAASTTKRAATAAAADPLAPTQPGARTGWQAALEELAVRTGARVERLLDGSIVATVIAEGAATDGAVRAARCALGVRHLDPSGAIVVATGRGQVAEHLPVGDVIDRAAAMIHRRRERGDAAGIAIDEATAGLLDQRFLVEAGPDGFGLAGEQEGADAPRTLLGRPTACVGRDRELGMLSGLLAEVMNEPVARAALVIAPPGTGKSRLRRELLRRIAEEGRAVEIWIALGEAMSAGSPFWMLGQILRRAAGIQANEDAESQRRKLRARVARHLSGADVDRTIAFLGEIAGVPFPDDADPALGAARRDPQLMSDRTRDAFAAWVGAESRAQPVAMILEDMHWGDRPSAACLDWALRQHADQPLFVVGFARPEVDAALPGLWRERGVQRIDLPQLSRKACERLIGDVLGDRIDVETRARIVALCAGNAFYLEELIRAVAEGRRDLPESVLAMAQIRFQALPPDERRILRAASVLGEVFWEGAARALLPAEAEQVPARLQALAGAESIERRSESRFAGEAEYRFRHALLREAAYAALTEEDRVLGHRLAADWLAAAGERDAATLGEHRERAGDRAQAARHYRRAAEQALDGGDFAAARARAVGAVKNGAAGDDLVACRLIEIEALKWEGRMPTMVERARSLMHDVPVGSPAWCRAVGDLGVMNEHLEPLEDALADLDPAPAHAIDYLTCAARVVSQSCIQLRHERVAPIFERMEAIAARAPDMPPAAQGWLQQALAFRAAAMGDLGEALRWFRASRASFEAAGDARNAVAQLIDECYTLCDLGRPAELEASAREAMAICEAKGLIRLRPHAQLMVSQALALRGRVAEGTPHIEAAVQDFEKSGHPNHGVAVEALAMHRRAEGKLEEAERLARQAVKLTKNIRYYDPRGTLALILVEQGLHEEALALLAEPPRKSVILMESWGGPARQHLARALALDGLGRKAEARAAIRDGRRHVEAVALLLGDPADRRSYLGNTEDARRVLELAAAWS